MKTRVVAVFIALMLVAVACGGSDAESSDTDAPTPTEIPTTEAATAAPPGTEAPSSDDEPAESSTSTNDPSATLTLDNGEVYKFGILCALEPQESAGAEILFVVVSYDEPYNLDVNQFGADSFGGEATISVYDAETYDTLWEAGAFSEATLELSGSTVTGSGTFLEGGELGATEVHGELVADC
ncbi:MAG: hypothetical protein U9N56_09180 [Actinomycetota bacterium]|nr:hypothetical protein [Actinomycetota bacterium]